MRDRLADLQALCDLRFEAEQAEMAHLRRQQAELEMTLSDLSGQRQVRADKLADQADAAFVAGADLAWQSWVESRRSQINTELARIRARQEACRESLAQAFGRAQAVKGLREQS